MVISQELLLLVLYRIIPVIIGALIIRWGYHLYIKGINLAGAQNIKAVWNDFSIVIKNAAPGTVCIIVGGWIAIASIYKGGEIKTSTKNNIHSPNAANEKELQAEKGEDSTALSFNKKPNIDSLLSVARKRFDKKLFLDAYRDFYLIKGILCTSDATDRIKGEVDTYIKLTKKELTEIINSNRQNLTVEDTKSISINDESLDSTK